MATSSAWAVGSVFGLDPVMGTREQCAACAVDQYRADRHLTQIRGELRLVDREFHRRGLALGHRRSVPSARLPVKVRRDLSQLSQINAGWPFLAYR